MKAKTEEKKQPEEENKEKKPKKKVKEGANQIKFGKGSRKFFEFIQVLEAECGRDLALLKKKLDFFTNRELQSVLREICESSND